MSYLTIVARALSHVMPSRTAALGAVLAVGGALAAGGANANLLTNGSFETPTVPVGGITNFSVGEAGLTGWNVIGPNGATVALISGSFTQNGVTFNAGDGAQWLDLTGNGSNGPEGVSQAVATKAGELYQLAFLVGNTSGGGIFGSTSTVDVLLTGTQTFADTNSNADPTGQNWEQFTQQFVATGATTTLAFLNGDTLSDNDNGLDDIVLLDLGPGTISVPEAPTLLLIVTALLGLAWSQRRRAI